jgi:hypothetical protein
MSLYLIKLNCRYILFSNALWVCVILAIILKIHKKPEKYFFHAHSKFDDEIQEVVEKD